MSLDHSFYALIFNIYKSIYSFNTECFLWNLPSVMRGYLFPGEKVTPKSLSLRSATISNWEQVKSNKNLGRVCGSLTMSFGCCPSQDVKRSSAKVQLAHQLSSIKSRGLVLVLWLKGSLILVHELVNEGWQVHFWEIYNRQNHQRPAKLGDEGRWLSDASSLGKN